MFEELDTIDNTLSSQLPSLTLNLAHSLSDSAYLTLFGKVVALATLLTQPIRFLDMLLAIVSMKDFTLCRYIVHARVSTTEEHQTGTNSTALQKLCQTRAYQAGYFSPWEVDDNF